MRSRARIATGRRIITLLGAVAALAAPARGDESADAEGLIRELRASRGICVVAADADGVLAQRIAEGTELLVYTRLADDAKVEAARRRAARAGLGASRLHIDRGGAGPLPLSRDLATAVIVTADAAVPLAEDEVRRVLRPLGRALIGEREIVEPWPEGLDDWSHPYHGPDNNPLSKDRVIRAPYETRFLANPRYAPAPQVAVAAGGRVFKAFGHVAWHEREEPFLNTLAAYDGFNGTLLWSRPLPEGYMVHRNTIVATADALYLGGDSSLQRIDARTGELLAEHSPPESVATGAFWKWLAIEGDRIYGLIGAPEPKDETRRWRRQAHGWPWDRISDGYNRPDDIWGFGAGLVALDRESGEVVWSHREEAPADARGVCMAGGRIFLFRFGEYMAAIDAARGEELWRRTRADDPAHFERFGAYLTRQGWQTNWRTASYAKATPEAVYFAGPQLSKLLAVSATDGSILWEDPYDNFQLIVRDDGLWAISGPWGHDVSKRFDPLTGEVLASLPTGRRACTRPTGTLDSILFRAMGGSVRLDCEAGRPDWISPMRPQCQDGVTIANGHLYWWPYTCDCQLSLYGVIALGPAGSDGFDAPPPPELEVLASLDASSSPLEVTDADWPTFRAGNDRRVTSPVAIVRGAELAWTRETAPERPYRPTAPVAAGELVYLAGSDGVVRAHDAATGEERWQRSTGGEVRVPPTIARGRALVGSGDGHVYALDARDGRLLWRRRIAPRARTIPVYGELLSTWPAASGVLVEGDRAFVAAGIVNYDGTHVVALDVATGEVAWRNDTSGHLDPVARTGVSVQGHLLSTGGRLYLAGGNAVSPAVYDPETGRCLNDPGPLAKCESTSARGWELFQVGERVIAAGRPWYSRPDDPVYDHTVTKKLLHASSAGGRDLVWVDGAIIASYPRLETEWLTKCVTDEKQARHITQAWGEFDVPVDPAWARQTDGAEAVALTSDAVVVALRDRVRAFDMEDGEEIWSVSIPAAPVPWGLAIDRDGRALVTLEGGGLCAIAPPR